MAFYLFTASDDVFAGAARIALINLPIFFCGGEIWHSVSRMPRVNEYEKDPNGSYKDFWGTRYSPVSGGGSTLLGFLLIGYVIYTYIQDNSEVLVGIITAAIALILFIWSAFSKKPKLVAVLYTLALFFSALTITSSEDIYRLYRFRVVHLIVLYSVLFLYMVMAAYGRGKPRIVFFVLSLASLGAVVYIAEGGNILNGFSIVEVPGYLFSTAQLPTLV